MPKIKFKEIKESATNEVLNARRFYETKYYGLFLNAYDFTNLSKEQKHYLLKAMWMRGTCAAFIIEGTKPDASLKDILSNKTASSLVLAQEEQNGLLCFVPYAPVSYNIDDFPSVITYVAKRGAQFIPQTPKVVNRDCVIGYAHTSHASVRSMVMFYIEKIVDVEKTIETNLFTHKLPRLIICSPEDKQRVSDIVEAIENGEHKLFLDVQDWQAIKNVLDSGNGSYIIDKLYQYKTNLENELLTFLGINNVAIQKAERLITDEANSNNELINDSSDCFLDSLRDFCEDISTVLGYEIEVKAKSSPASNEMVEEINDEGGEEDYEN